MSKIKTGDYVKLKKGWNKDHSLRFGKMVGKVLYHVKDGYFKVEWPDNSKYVYSGLVLEKIKIMSEIKIKFKKLHPDAKMPVKSTEFAGAYDVFCTEVKITENEDGYPLFICYTGLAMQFPIGYRLMLHPRSSISKYSIFLANSVGIGDADYTGEYQFRFACTGYVNCPYKPGDRIGQIYLEKEIPTVFEEVEELIEYDREGGFGSTGK